MGASCLTPTGASPPAAAETTGGQQQDERTVNPALATGLPPPVHYQQLGLGTVLARAQARDGVGPAVELRGSGTSLTLTTKGRPLTKSASRSSEWKARLWPCPLAP